jgi:hypothetical protein
LPQSDLPAEKIKMRKAFWQSAIRRERFAIQRQFLNLKVSATL